MKGIRLEIIDQDKIELNLRMAIGSETRLRLLFINSFLKNNSDLEHTCDSFRISIKTGYEWISNWNKFGVNGLSDKPITGRKAKLTHENINTLKFELEKKDFWDISEISDLVTKLFNVELARSNICKILKDLEMTHAKPYRKDYRRPENADEILINALNKTFELIIADGIDPEDVGIGFVDEAHPQNKANSGKMWSFGKKVLQENTTKFKVNTIAFYALNGNDAMMFLEDSKDEGIAQFLIEIRNQNPDPEAIIVLLDNLSAHKTDLCVKTARDNGIYLVFIPPYSPDLNPIEFAWKTTRRMISKFFITSKEQLQDIISYTFEYAAKSLSLAKSWIEKVASKVKHLQFLTEAE